MKNFDESNLCFSFGNSWTVIAYDEHPDYLNIFQKLEGTKAIDFLGVHGNSIYFIEVKNFSGHLAQYEGKISQRALKNDLVQKFRDTNLWVLLAHHRYGMLDWMDYAQVIGNQKKGIKFVAWIELGFGLDEYPVKKLKGYWSTLQNQLKQTFSGVKQYDKKISFLITASNFNQNTLPDLTVRRCSCSETAIK
ncbi:MAG: NERD domain-containing protein [Chloroflexi bacterium]|nr:NERD domain-containing protein [Chloroflexota bacterium]